MGSDISASRLCVKRYCFNSRSRMGSDSTTPATPWRDSKFQFTLPHGERQRRRATRRATPSFNSRSRMRSDAPPDSSGFGIRQFQFTLPHGERLADFRACNALSDVSIHAPARGATGGVCLSLSCVNVSIHAPAWGATRSPLHPQRMFGFQFTLPHGERRKSYLRFVDRFGF